MYRHFVAFSSFGFLVPHSLGAQNTQVLTIDGDQCVQNHDHQPEYPQTKPIINKFSTVPIYNSSETVEVLEEISMHIFRVKVLDSIYCMKSIGGFWSRSRNAFTMCSS